MLKVELLSTVKGASPITRLAADGQPLKEIDGDIEFAPALTSDFLILATLGDLRAYAGARY